MAKRSENEGFRVLDDFVCNAIAHPGILQADPKKQGKNEGIRVIEELVFGSESGTKALVIAVLGTRGGVGSTSIAVNLGCTLAQNPQYDVALIDLDLAFGDADVSLDLTAEYTLADTALNLERLDVPSLRHSLSKHSSGISVLPHPVQIEDVAQFRGKPLERLIGLLGRGYSHVILDLSKSFSATDVTALGMADVILLVSQLELTSLRNTVRVLLTLGADPALADKVKVVLNRVGPDTDISLTKAEETIGRPIDWQVPADASTMRESHNAGVPLVQHAPRSKIQQSIAGLAHALESKQDTEPVGPNQALQQTGHASSDSPSDDAPPA